MAGALTIEGLVVEVGGRRLVHGLDLEVPGGSVVGVVGGSGSGKSTVLDVLAGRRRPDAGRVLLDGRPVDLVRVGFAAQEHDLIGGLTAVENVAARVLALHGRADDGWGAIPDLLARLGLPEASWHNLAEQLSGGQQQRVAVARALVDAPPLLCLDDPTSELDEASADLVREQIAAAAAGGAVAVVAVPVEADGPPFDAVIRPGA